MKMKYAAVIAMLSLTGLAQAAGNPSAGQSKAGSCAGCHGINGVSIAEGVPYLAGQKEKYFVKQMMDMQDGVRKHSEGAREQLSSQDIEDLAAYYASLPVMRGKKTADSELAKAGGEMYNSIAACAMCHGEDGRIDNPNVPIIGGQDKTYLMKALMDYKNLVRKEADTMRIMDAAIAKLMEKDLKAIVEYISSQ